MLEIISKSNGPSTKEQYESYFGELSTKFSKKDIDNFIKMTIMDSRIHEDINSIFGPYDRITFKLEKNLIIKNF